MENFRCPVSERIERSRCRAALSQQNLLKDGARGMGVEEVDYLMVHGFVEIRKSTKSVKREDDEA